MPELTVTLTEDERQAVLLALALCARERPGWDEYLGAIAGRLGGRDLYATFKRTLAPAPGRGA